MVGHKGVGLFEKFRKCDLVGAGVVGFRKYVTMGGIWGFKDSSLWQNSTSFHDKSPQRLEIQRPYIKIIKAVYIKIISSINFTGKNSKGCW